MANLYAPSEGYVPGVSNYFMQQRANTNLFKGLSAGAATGWQHGWDSPQISSKLTGICNISTLGNGLPYFSVSDRFFSRLNCEWLISLVCREVVRWVWIKNGEADGKRAARMISAKGQSSEHMLYMMRQVYSEEIRRMDSSVCLDAQLQYLNSKVLEKAVPNSFENLAHYLVYMRDASSQPTPHQISVGDSIRGTQTHRTKGGNLIGIADVGFM